MYTEDKKAALTRYVSEVKNKSTM